MSRELANVELFELCETSTRSTMFPTVLFIGIKGLCIALADNAWFTANPEESLPDKDWMHSLSQNYVVKKGATHGARHGKTEVQREYHMAWNAWKRCCKKVGSQGEPFTQVFTIDFSEIQFIVNHNSRNRMVRTKSTKSGMNLQQQKIIQTNSLQRKRADTRDNGILLWTKKAKMGLWGFDLITEAAVIMKNRLHHESGEPIEEPIHPGQQRRTQQGQENFFEDCLSSARIDQHTGWQCWP